MYPSNLSSVLAMALLVVVAYLLSRAWHERASESIECARTMPPRAFINDQFDIAVRLRNAAGGEGDAPVRIRLDQQFRRREGEGDRSCEGSGAPCRQRARALHRAHMG